MSKCLLSHQKNELDSHGSFRTIMEMLLNFKYKTGKKKDTKKDKVPGSINMVTDKVTFSSLLHMHVRWRKSVESNKNVSPSPSLIPHFSGHKLSLKNEKAT